MSHAISPSIRFPIAAALCAALLLAACKKDRDETSTPQTAETPVAAPAPPAPVELKDVIENDARYIVGISYPKQAAKYPGLAEALHRYAETARGELLKAVAAGDAAKQNGPYDLTLNFTLVAETPEVVGVAADGSSFTGGAHGTPLVARFVWLPQQNKLLASDQLFADPRSWAVISDYTREQLHAALSQRVDDDELPPEERADIMRSVGKMIDAGTEPQAASFAAFEPVLAPDSDKLMALRFVFPPYQVGPYVDGVRTVEVPTAVLLPHLAPEFRGMFVVAKPAVVAEAAPEPAAPPTQ